MARAPKSPDELIGPVVEGLRSVFGDELISVALYGSAARGEYRPGRSDINFFVVVSGPGMERYEDLMPFLPKWRKRGVAVPRVVTPEYIQRSLDSFPMEFLSLKLFHRIVYGEELFASLEIDPGNLRLQCERELKGKLLHLREGYLLTGGKRKALQQLIRVSLPTFATVFEAILFLKGQEPPVGRRELFHKVSDILDLDAAVFEELIQVREGTVKRSQEDLRALCRGYIREIEKAATAIDRLDVTDI